MRILFLHTASILGGSERAYLDLLERLPVEHRQQSIVVLPDQGELKNAIDTMKQPPRTEVIGFPKAFEATTRKFPILSFAQTAFSLPLLVPYLNRISQIIKREKIEFIYSNGIKCHLLSLELLRRHPQVQLVWHLQDYFPDIHYVRAFMKLFRSGPKLVIGNSAAVTDALSKIVPSHWSTRFDVVHNAVDPKAFAPRAGERAQQIVISLVAMLTPWKGQKVFIEAAEKLLSQNKNLKFQIVGDEVYSTRGESGYKTELMNLVKVKGLSDAIVFKGFVKNIESVYHASDIMVHASTKPEPFGRVIIEAMACEKPIVATRGGGVTEIINDGVNGLLAEMNNATSLAEQISKLIQSPELRKKLARAGRETVLNRFSADAYAQKIRENLERL